MVASKEFTKLPNSRAKLSVTIDKEEVGPRYASFVKELAKDMQIPGFRKGKVPVSVLETKFGKELKAEAFGKMMEDSLEELWEKGDVEKPLPYARPELEGEIDFDTDKDFNFTVLYDLFPTYEVADYKGIEVEAPNVEIEKEDEERELKKIQERNAVILDKADSKPAVNEDIATVDYCELDEKGDVIDGSKRESFVFTIGSGYNIYKFDDEVVGMKKGDTKDFKKSFPEDFEDAALKGKNLSIRVKLAELKEKQLPALDDDLAQDVSEKYKTVADLRADIRKDLESQLDAKMRELKVGKIVEALIEKTTIELPESMIQMELASRWDNLKQRIGAQTDAKLEQFLTMSGKTQEAVFAEWRPHSEKSLKGRLILEKLMEAEKIEISDAEIEAEITRAAEAASMSIEEVKDRYSKGGMMDYLKEDLKERKIYDVLMAAAKIKKGKKEKFVDLFAASE